MHRITDKHYAIDDDVFAILDLHPAVQVRMDTEEEIVKLFLGRRDYEWLRGYPDVYSVMTGFHRPLHGPQREDL